ncbi:unnamed protein product, partial [Clonostachys solani]
MSLVQKLLDPCTDLWESAVPPHLFNHGSSRRFEEARNEWKLNSTQDSVLADFAKFLLHGRAQVRPIIDSKEAETLERIFTSHVNSNNCWDRQSLKSYLATKVPGDANFQDQLRNAIPALWALVVYFSQWPFNATVGPSVCQTTADLAFPAFVRATAFLCGRHEEMFGNWADDDTDFNRGIDQPVIEDIFRALATKRPEDQSPFAPTKIPRLLPHDDALDVVGAVHPWLNEFSRPLSRDELTPVARRLRPSAPPELSDLVIQEPRQTLIPLLQLSVSVVEQALTLDGANVTTSLRDDLKTAHAELQKAERVPFGLFADYLDTDQWVVKHNDVYTVYNAS